MVKCAFEQKREIICTFLSCVPWQIVSTCEGLLLCDARTGQKKCHKSSRTMRENAHGK
jgi:hypothetical protein